MRGYSVVPKESFLIFKKGQNWIEIGVNVELLHISFDS